MTLKQAADHAADEQLTNQKAKAMAQQLLLQTLQL
jgi:hypothetical protein